MINKILYKVIGPKIVKNFTKQRSFMLLFLADFFCLSSALLTRPVSKINIIAKKALVILFVVGLDKLLLSENM